MRQQESTSGNLVFIANFVSAGIAEVLEAPAYERALRHQMGS